MSVHLQLKLNVLGLVLLMNICNNLFSLVSVKGKINAVSLVSLMNRVFPFIIDCFSFPNKQAKVHLFSLVNK